MTVFALRGLNTWDISFLRSIFAALVLMAYLRDRRLFKMSRKDLSRLMVLSALGISAIWVLLTLGVEYSTPVKAALVSNTSPLLVVLLAKVFLSEELKAKRIGGVALGLTGTYIVMSNGRPLDLLSSETLLGDAASLGVAVSWAFYMILYKRYISELKMDTNRLTFNLFLFAIPQLLILELLASNPTHNLLKAPLEAFVATLWMGAVSSGVGFLILNRSLRVLSASKAAVNLMVIPLSGMAVANLVLGEELTPYKIFGGLMIILGIAVAEVIGGRRA